MDITTKMHIALAVMLVAYIIPMVYLVHLARLEMRRTEADNATQTEPEHSSQSSS